MDSPLASGIPAPRACAMRVVVLLVACVAVASACTSDRPTPASNAPSPVDSDASQAPPSNTPDGDGSAAAPGKRSSATVVEDPAGTRTASGSVPPYVEIERASVKGDVETLNLAVRLAETVPQKMPDRDTSFRASFRLLTDEGGRYLLEAQASEEGWVASASGGTSEGFPGRLRVAGSEIQMEIDRRYVTAPTFRWLVNVAWTRTRGGSAYGFDVAPEGGFVRFPGRG